MKLVVYGDSNTYGYDPADWVSGRYPDEICWPERLQKILGEKWEVIPQGLNGRKLPDLRYDRDIVLQMCRMAGPAGLLAVMLGTNDLLQSIHPDAAAAERKMEKLLGFLSGEQPELHVLIIAPVPVGAEDHPDPLMRRYYEESLRMNRMFAQLAETYHSLFADAADWEIDRAYDLVHFSEEGHRVFAEKMAMVLR